MKKIMIAAAAAAALLAGITPAAHAAPASPLETTSGVIKVIARTAWCLTGEGRGKPVTVTGCDSGPAQQWIMYRTTVTGGKAKGTWLALAWGHDPSLCVQATLRPRKSAATLVACVSGSEVAGIMRMTAPSGTQDTWLLAAGPVRLAVPVSMQTAPRGRLTSYTVTWQSSTRYRYSWDFPGGWHPYG